MKKQAPKIDKEYTSLTVEKPALLEFTSVVNDMRRLHRKTTREFTNTDGLLELIRIYKKEVMK